MAARPSAADHRVVCSPALRTRETAGALSSKVEVTPDLAPGADVSAILAAIDWPQGHEHTVVVGHQPWIGRLASLLLAGHEINWSVRRAASGGCLRARATPRPRSSCAPSRSRFPPGRCAQVRNGSAAIPRQCTSNCNTCLFSDNDDGGMKGRWLESPVRLPGQRDVMEASSLLHGTVTGPLYIVSKPFRHRKDIHARPSDAYPAAVGRFAHWPLRPVGAEPSSSSASTAPNPCTSSSACFQCGVGTSLRTK